MPTPAELADICDIPLELNTIKESLNKIPDTALALDILTALEKVDQQAKRQQEILDKNKEEADTLRKTNNALMIRATAQNSVLPPASTVDFNNISAQQSIIDRV